MAQHSLILLQLRRSRQIILDSATRSLTLLMTGKTEVCKFVYSPVVWGISILCLSTWSSSNVDTHRRKRYKCVPILLFSQDDIKWGTFIDMKEIWLIDVGSCRLLFESYATVNAQMVRLYSNMITNMITADLLQIWMALRRSLYRCRYPAPLLPPREDSASIICKTGGPLYIVYPRLIFISATVDKYVYHNVAVCAGARVNRAVLSDSWRPLVCWIMPLDQIKPRQSTWLHKVNVVKGACVCVELGFVLS